MSERANQIILDHSRQGAVLREAFFQENAESVVRISREIALCLTRGGKIMLCGNGGSAADAQHLAAEFVNRFLMERPPLPAMALTTDTSVLTAIGNDYDFSQVFLKQVQAHGTPGDVLVGISTSGKSANVNSALRWAHENGLTTVGLSGGSGGEMRSICIHLLHVESTDTPLIQEIHIAAGHLICRLVDYFLFEAVSELEQDLADPKSP